MHEEIAILWNDLKQIEDTPTPVSRRGRPQSGQDIANSTLLDLHETPLDKINFSTTESIIVLSNSP